MQAKQSTTIKGKEFIIWRYFHSTYIYRNKFKHLSKTFIMSLFWGRKITNTQFSSYFGIQFTWRIYIYKAQTWVMGVPLIRLGEGIINTFSYLRVGVLVNHGCEILFSGVEKSCSVRARLMSKSCSQSFFSFMWSIFASDMCIQPLLSFLCFFKVYKRWTTLV